MTKTSNYCRTHKMLYEGFCPNCAMEEPPKRQWCATHKHWYYGKCQLCVAQELLNAGKMQSVSTSPHIGAAIAKETPLISAHALAAAELLQQVVDRLHGGVPPEDLGFDVQRIGTMMRREI